MAMKAIRIEQFCSASDLAVREVPVATPGADEVLVRTVAIGVNFVDTQHRAGQPYPTELPLTLGIEAAGEVVAVGAAVQELAVGQPVAVAGPMIGAYAEYFVCPARLIVPLPAGTTYQQAAALLLQGMTAEALSHQAHAIGADDTVLVQAAAGGVGLLLTQIAKMRGATVIGTCSTEAKAQAVRAAGGDYTVRYTECDLTEAVMEITDGRGVNVVFDAVGRATFDAGIEVLCDGGHMVVYGLASGPVPPFDINRLSGIGTASGRGCLSLTWASLSTYNADRTAMVRRATMVLDWARTGRLSATIAATFRLDRAADAHLLLEQRGSIGKVLLQP